ncbi:MAG: hypothetical protein WCN85_05475 [Burkholderiales bacterium]
MSAIVTLIPAYKPEYLGDLFIGLRTQKFKDFRIVLSDDSPGGEITERIRAGTYGPLARELNLLVVRGPCQGANKNIQHLIEGWADAAPLVHIHLDDDVIYPDFYRAHAHANCGSFSASVSLRWVTSPDGRPSQELPLPAFLEIDNTRIVAVSSDQMFGSTVPDCVNWLGELSNVVLSTKSARRYLDSSMSQLSYYGLGDVGLLLDVSRYAPVAVIRDHLSGFRSSAQQTSAQPQSFPVKCGHLAWIALAMAAWREERVSPKQAVQSLGIALERSARLYTGDEQIEPFFEMFEAHKGDLGSLANAFELSWSHFLERHPYSKRWTARDPGTP